MADDDEIITEERLAEMFMEEEQPAAEAPEPEPEEPEVVEITPEPPEIIPEPEPQEGLRPEELPGEEPIPEGVTEAVADHLAWAERRNLTTFEEAAKLAFEQEKFLGRRSTELEELREEVAELRQAQAQPQQPAAAVSPEWIAQAISSPDPGRFAYDLAASGNWAAYEEMMQAWEEQVGATITMGVHNTIVAALNQPEEPEPEAPEEDAGANVRRAFQQVGIIDLDHDPLRPMLMQIADELGGDDPLIQSLARGDASAAHALLKMAQMRTVVTRTVRLDGTPVDNGRQNAAKVTGSGSSPTRTPPPENPFAGEEEEWRRMGVLPME